MKKGCVVCEFDYGLLDEELLGKTILVSYDFKDLGVKGLKRLLNKIDGYSSIDDNLIFAKYRFYSKELMPFYP